MNQRPDWHDLFLNAALEPERWPDALDCMASHLGASHGQLIGLGGDRNRQFSIITGISEADMLKSEEMGGGSPEFNFRLAASSDAIAKRQYDIILDESHYEAARARLIADQHARWCDEFDIPFGCQSGLIVDRVGVVGLATLRKRREGKTTPEQLALFTQATLAARHAVRLQERLEGSQAALLAGAFEAISVPAFILDARGQVQAMTSGGEQYLDNGDIKLRNRKLFAAGTPWALEKCLAAMLGDDGLHHVRLRIDLPEDRPPLFMEGFRLPQRALSLGNLPFAILLARPPQRDRAGVAAFLAALYRLTASEADIAIRLYEGLDRAGISAARAVSTETVNTQIKSIYAKTALSSTTALVRLLASIMS